jgi:ubiquitin-protein ligase
MRRPFPRNNNFFLELAQEPTEGFVAELVNDNLFTWHIFVEGPADTPYAKGIFKLLMVQHKLRLP